MTVDEATKLHWMVHSTARHLQPEIRQIANGERVVYLAAVEYFLLSMADWKKYKNTPT